MNNIGLLLVLCVPIMMVLVSMFLRAHSITSNMTFKTENVTEEFSAITMAYLSLAAIAVVVVVFVCVSRNIIN
jgi:hypothetical protein